MTAILNSYILIVLKIYQPQWVWSYLYLLKVTIRSPQRQQEQWHKVVYYNITVSLRNFFHVIMRLLVWYPSQSIVLIFYSTSHVRMLGFKSRSNLPYCNFYLFGFNIQCSMEVRKATAVFKSGGKIFLHWNNNFESLWWNM